MGVAAIVTELGRFSYTPFSSAGTAKEQLSRQNDARLIAQVLSGQNEAFADLLQPHLSGLLRFVQAKMRDDSEAEDIVQQTVFKAFTKLQQFRSEASFRTWLIQIAVNEVRQWQRKCRTSRTISIDQTAPERVKFADPSASPFQVCERQETIRSLQMALAKLPEAYGLMIRLRDLRQLNIAETAGLLHLNISTVKTRHRRARLLMARLLAPMRQTRYITVNSPRPIAYLLEGEAGAPVRGSGLSRKGIFSLRAISGQNSRSTSKPMSVTSA